jgi:hypothetical protein
MLQRSQLVSVPLSFLSLGLLTSLLYTRALGWSAALLSGALLGLLMGLLAAWLVYRSDFAARNFVANAVLLAMWMVPFLGGANLALAQMAGAEGWALAAWAVGVGTVLVPIVGPAWLTHAKLVAEGDAGPWTRNNLDLRKGLLLPGALASQAPAPSAMLPWQVGALAANVPLAWRLMGGGQTTLMALAVVGMACAVVWVCVRQIGPALGKAWFLLELEQRTGQRLRSPQWDQIQALRRSHWLARWFMREA